MDIPPIPRMARAIDAGNVSEIRSILKEHPDQLTYLGGGGGSWLHRAASDAKIEVIDALIESGMDININALGNKPEQLPPLVRAVSHGHIETARHLIARGAWRSDNM